MTKIPEDIRIDTGEKKKKSGRPRVEIDLELVKRAASIGATIQDISALTDIPVGTLSNRPDFTETYNKAIQDCKMSVRLHLFKLMQSGNTVATLFLAKNYLGLKDKPDEPEEPAAEVVIRMRPRKLADDTHNQDDDE